MPRKAKTENAAELAAKERIHQEIVDLVKEKTDVRIGLAEAKKIFDTVVTRIFSAAVSDTQFRFPGGFGSLHVKKLGEGTKPRTLPSGQQVTLGPNRVKLRYIEGVAVKDLLGTNKAKNKKAAAETPVPEAATAASV